MSFDNDLYYSNQLIDINAVFTKITNITVSNSPYTITTNYVVYSNVIEGPIIVILSNNTALPNQQVVIKNVDSTLTGNSVTIMPPTGSTVEGGASYILTSNNTVTLLKVISGAAFDWQILNLSGGGGGTGLLINKGDILTHNGTSEVRLPVGVDGFVLEADSATAEGIKWSATGGGGEVNTASNVGTGGIGLFDAKVVADLQFKNINSGSSKVTVTDDPANKEVDIDIDESSININSLGGTPLTVPNGGTGVATLTSGNVLVGVGVAAVTTTKPAPIGDFVGTTDVQILTNKTITATTNNVAANSLKTLTGIVTVSTAAAPSIGQVLTATSATTATWQAGGGSSIATYELLSIETRAASTSYNNICYFPWLHSRYSGYTSGTIILNVTIFNRDLDIRLEDIDGAAILGSATITSSGSSSFAITNPAANTKIAVQIRKSAGGGRNPRILGINLEYST